MARGLFAALLLLLMAPARARAYPHFQLSSGSAQCSQCHVAPAGGGLLTEWGQEELAETLAGGGDGRFLHGALSLPSWLQLGGEVRVAALANDVGSTERAELAVFPMQLDLSLRVASGAWSASAVVGARGRVRTAEEDSASLARYLISREHYAMWQPGAQGVYARIGRFAAPYGLRLADHTAYVRRYLGFNLLEETYNLGGGWLGDDWELHVTAFLSGSLQGAAPRELGVAATYEKQISPTLLVGTSARAAVSEPRTRVQGGLHGKWWAESAKLLFQAQVDAVRESFEGPGARWQLAAHAGPVLVPRRGLYAGLAYQLFAEDLQVRSVTRHAGEAWLSCLPRAHFEVMASARAQWIGPHERAYLALLQLHYSL